MKDPEFKGTRKKPLKIGTMQTIDAQTGDVVSERRNAMTILPPKSGCPECGVDHPHNQPHDQQSLVYQYQFHATHGRWPQWTDAMAHCTDKVKTAWREKIIEVMKKHGIPIPDDLTAPAGTTGR